MVTVYTNAKLVTGGELLQGQDVVVENGVIRSIVPQGSVAGEILDLQGDYLSTGFIDLHCHGAGGDEFIDGDPAGARRVCAIHAQGGTRVLYPTISATDYDTMYAALEAIEKVQQDCDLIIPGVHLEGPYLSPEMCGAQDCSYITAPVAADYTRLIDRFGSLIARWTYAPERDDTTFCKALTAQGIVPSMGHSAAEYEDVCAAYDAGCKLVTHFYSCTSTIVRRGGFRHLGIIETAYLLDDMTVEAIGDGCHLPPELMRLIVKLKGADKVCLITDAIRYAGPQAAEQTLGGTANVPYLIEDGVAKLMDRSAFAGSIATTETLLQRTVAAGIPLPEVVRMLTETPAKTMGLTDCGSIAAGKRALFTRFDENLNVKPL